MKRGLFIAFEGIDGAGTTSQAQRLASWLQARGEQVHLTRQPSDLEVGRLLRQALAGDPPLGGDGAHTHTMHAQTMALLFAADRLDHVARQVQPQLARGAVVITDRYVLSSIVYQSATAPAQVGFDFEQWVRSLNRCAPAPDLTLLLDVRPEVAAQRRARRAAVQEIYETDDLQRELARRYREASSDERLGRLVHIDGNGSLEEVAAAVTAVVLARL